MRAGAALAAGLLIGLGGCSAAAAPGPAAPDAPVRLTVLAAASLTEAFGTLGSTYEHDHPGVVVQFSFGSSATLAAQVAQGAPADVFAAASGTTMDTAAAAGAVATPVVFATNTLQIAVPPANRAHVRGLADFANPRLRIAVCAPQVPCGAAATAAFADAGITPAPDSEEQDVKAVLRKVEADEVDAGLVYRTDVRAAGDGVRGIGFPEASREVSRYPIATVTASAHPAEARAFTDFVVSARGREILAAAGFGTP